MTPRRLLVVEDDGGLGRALTRLLRSYGHDVYLAEDCAQARSAPGRFSLGVFDVDLPDGDGVALARELHESGTVKRVVFFTGSADAYRRGEASGLGPSVNKGRGVAVLRIAIEGALKEQVALRVVGASERPRHASSTAPPPSNVRRRDDD